ncbi:hypothetical protein CCYN74_40012 [Capnocytophaga cynodegmi]|uniref:Uncharacterized protein n=1 Tax=Capnocytophaga cynodegmi TaxID=28189 RepID=A0A0B7HIP1_9FLAO|nr:hypothetical protein CCYN74_40012 [Capnocytophaga cynodegmi]
MRSSLLSTNVYFPLLEIEIVVSVNVANSLVLSFDKVIFIITQFKFKNKYFTATKVLKIIKKTIFFLDNFFQNE